ncbi:hypothetical protein L7F22_022604 [Adiantum nelumboides]|nr:hypothetical protein [Adiantum nelumboides]
MGCTQSRFKRERSVTSRCRNRELLIKQCVQKQHAFAAAHATYIRSLRDVGAALRQFGEGGDVKPDTVQCHGKDFSLDMADDSRQLAHTFGTPYFPPPLPHFLSPFFLSRACTMPQFNFSSPHALSVAKTLIFSSPRNSFTYTAEEIADTDAGAVRKSYYVKPPPPLPAQLVTPPAPPSKGSQWEFYNVFQLADQKNPAFILEEEPGDESVNANAEELKAPSNLKKTPELVHPSTELSEELSAQRPEVQISGVDFARRLKELDDNFLQAYESGREVARLLEGQRTLYYSSFASYTNSCDHSARVLRVMSWGRNAQFASITDEATAKTLGSEDEKETHAARLDKLLAWEKKLYDEVKVGEVIRIKLERKSVELRKQRKREESSLSFKKTKAIVKDLQTRYLVEVQAVDAASSRGSKAER